GVGLRAAVGGIPCVVDQAGSARIIAIAKSRRGARPGGVLPFDFRRKTVLTAWRNHSRSKLLRGQQGTVVGGFGPTHAFDGPVQVARELTRIGANHSQVFSLGYLVFPHPETMTNGDGGLRAFVGAMAHFVSGAAQLESTG